MAFKNNVKFKIIRRQEYMENIESNYKEVMMKKEEVNTQRQSEMRIIQSISSQKSFSELNHSPVSSSPLVRKVSLPYQLQRQLSQATTGIQSFDSPLLNQDANQRHNIAERKALLSLCSPIQISASPPNSSLYDFENQFLQSQIRSRLFHKNYSQDIIAKKVLSTLNEVDQHYQSEEELQDRQYQPQIKLIKLVRTSNKDTSPQQLSRGSSIKYESIKSNSQSPVLLSRNKLSTELNQQQTLGQDQEQQNQLQQESYQQQLQQLDGRQQQTQPNDWNERVNIVRNKFHSKTTSCITLGNERYQNEIQMQRSGILQQRMDNQSQQLSLTSCPSMYQLHQMHQLHQMQQLQLQSQHELQIPTLYTALQQKQDNVIRSDHIEETTTTDLQEFLDVQYFQTQYNAEKLEEILKSAEVQKMKQKNNNNIIANKMEFLYDKKSKETGIRIGLIKQRIQNQYRIDLSHSNESYNKNRQNIYSNQPNKPVDKIAQFSKQYLKKQDAYDKIIRNKIIQSTQNVQSSNNIQKQIFNSSNNQTELSHQQENKMISSLQLTEFNDQNFNVPITSSNYNIQSLYLKNSENLQIKNTSIISSPQSYNPQSQNQNCESDKNSLQYNQQKYPINLNMIKSTSSSSSVQSSIKQPPLYLITQSPLQQTKSQFKFSQSPLKQQLAQSKNHFLNFQFIKPKSNIAVDSPINLNNNFLLNSCLQKRKSDIILPKDEDKHTDQQQQQQQQQQLEENDKMQQSVKMNKQQNLSPNQSHRMSNIQIGMSSSITKPFLIKSQCNTPTKYSKDPSPLKHQANLNIQQSQNSPILFQGDDQKQTQQFLFKHKKTQSQFAVDSELSHKQIQSNNNINNKSISQKEIRYYQDMNEKRNKIEKHKLHSSMDNISQGMDSPHKMASHQSISSIKDFFQLKSPISSLTCSSQKIKYRNNINIKINEIISDYTIPAHNKSNLSIADINQPNLLSTHSRSHTTLNTCQNEQKDILFSQKSANIPKQIQLNSRNGLKLSNSQKYKGSTINSSLNLKQFLDQIGHNNYISPSSKNIQLKQS